MVASRRKFLPKFCHSWKNILSLGALQIMKYEPKPNTKNHCLMRHCNKADITLISLDSGWLQKTGFQRNLLWKMKIDKNIFPRLIFLWNVFVWKVFPSVKIVLIKIMVGRRSQWKIFLLFGDSGLFLIFHFYLQFYWGCNWHTVFKSSTEDILTYTWTDGTLILDFLASRPQTNRGLPKWLYQFVFLLALNQGSCCSASSRAFSIVSILDFDLALLLLCL